MYVADGDYIKDIEINDLRNRYTLTKGSTQKLVITAPVLLLISRPIRQIALWAIFCFLFPNSCGCVEAYPNTIASHPTSFTSADLRCVTLDQ